MAANETSYDLVVVGGGINGVGIARDAAGRGLSVLLVEKDDLASHTSSWSSKLIHGGLRYLEHYEFRLVREALIEREVLLRAAPHLVKPMTFVLPHSPALRPRWMLRIGLFLYDHLGGRKILEPSRAVDLTAGPLGAPLKPSFTHGFTYSDAWVDDSRLVVVNALDAAAKGAVVRTRTRLVGAERAADHWRVQVADGLGGGEQTVRARGLVNAAGPWVSQLIGDVLHLPSRHAVRLVKGSHIVVPALYEGDHAYILQNEDQRIVFTIPYQAGRLTIIGTTDLAYEGDPAQAAITPEETEYLCATVAGYFERPPRPEDVVWSYSGVRPLYDDASGNPSAVTRDYVFDLDTANGAAPLLSVFGGKLTTYRKLAEHAMGKLAPVLGVTTPSWTEAASLPGGEIANADFEGFLDAQRRRYPFLPEATLERLAHAYGTRLDRVLGAARSEAELGADLGAGLSEVELRYLIGEEWARTAEDVLWRRTKLGLFLAPDAQAPLRAWFETATAASPAPSAAPS